MFRLGFLLLLLPCSNAVRSEVSDNETQREETGACGLFSNCCATAKCSSKKWFRASAGMYAVYEQCQPMKGAWKHEDGTLVTPDEVSFGLFGGLEKGEYVCRETCQIWLEDADGNRPSRDPEWKSNTVYRTGGDGDKANCRFGMVTMKKKA